MTAHRPSSFALHHRSRAPGWAGAGPGPVVLGPWSLVCRCRVDEEGSVDSSPAGSRTGSVPSGCPAVHRLLPKLPVANRRPDEQSRLSQSTSWPLARAHTPSATSEQVMTGARNGSHSHDRPTPPAPSSGEGLRLQCGGLQRAAARTVCTATIEVLREGAVWMAARAEPRWTASARRELPYPYTTPPSSSSSFHSPSTRPSWALPSRRRPCCPFGSRTC